MRLLERKSTKIPKRINIANLKLRADEHFRLELHNRFFLFQQISDTQPDTEWQALKSDTVEAAHTDLGITRRRCQDWITGESHQLAERARVAKLTGPANFHDLRRCATHSICTDRNAHWHAFACGDSQKLYQMVKQASRGSAGLSETLCSHDRAVIASLSERLNLWKEHFHELLNHSTPTTEVAVELADKYDCNTALSMVDEVRNILRRLRNNKAPGEDGIPAEVYKAMPDVFALWMHRVFNAVLLNETYPADWGDVILLPFFKKGDKKLCSKYRGISLINVVAKGFAVLLLRRFQRDHDL